MNRHSWLDGLGADPLPWLLEPANPPVRYLALTGLLGRPADDPEMAGVRQEILAFKPVRQILDAQWPEGYWMHPDVGYSPKYKATVWQIIFLAAMGVPPNEPVMRAVEYVLSHSRLPDGRFSARKDDKGALLCLNGNLLRALSQFGCADDPRVAKARQAMAAQIARDCFCCRYNAPAESRPSRMSDGLPCAWGAIKCLGALTALSPARRMPGEQVAIQKTVEFLLAYDLADGAYPTATEASPVWHEFGFPLGYTSDVLEALEVLLQAGVPPDHPRLQVARSLVLSKQDAQARWLLEYTPGRSWVSFGPLGKPSKWVTLRALRVLEYAR